jgi:hypothetical protein
MTTAATEALPGRTPHTAPGYARPTLSPAEAGVRGRTSARRWSRRQVPVTLLTSLAALAASACGALALDLIGVHTAHRPAAVIAVGPTALLGVWMVALAPTPGLGRRSTLIHDTVADVNGITTVRVRVRVTTTPEQPSATSAAQEVDQ